jgi:electron transport complex protein RnfG
MKKTMSMIAAAMIMVAVAASGKTADDVMKNDNGTYVVNTATLAKDVRGFRGPTPLKIYIKKNKVERIEALSNGETPKFFARVESVLLAKWNGMKVSKALETEVDGVSGATMSSKAVKENVKRGLRYYQKNK